MIIFQQGLWENRGVHIIVNKEFIGKEIIIDI